MSEATPTFSELFERALRSGLGDVNVSMPGVVVSYDAATQTATVRPGLRRVVFDENDEPGAEEIPPITNVPVSFPGGAGFTIHFPLAAGDTGDLIFSTWSLNEWQATGSVSTPGNLKLHDLGSAKFYPGIRSKKNAAPDTDKSIGIPGGQRAHFTELGVSIGTGADTAVVETKLKAVLAAACTAAGGAAATGDGGKAAFAAFASSLAAAPVGSSNLKADP